MAYCMKNPLAISLGTVVFEVSLADGKWVALHDLNQEILARGIAEQRKDRSLRIQYRDHHVNGETLQVAYDAVTVPVNPDLEDYSYNLREV